MPKKTRQSSGVVAGTMDISHRALAQPARVTAAGQVLRNRKRIRARLLAAARRRKAAAARTREPRAED